MTMNSKIVWIASYPKSGNTMVRTFLSCYFFTENGVLKDFSPLKNIIPFNSYKNFSDLKKFPEIEYFINYPEKISQYWIPNQNKITQNTKNEFVFFKTHNAQINFNSNYFTNNILTKCFVYIVRDPRSVLLSSMDHYGFSSFEDSKKSIFSDKRLTYASSELNLLPEFLLSWKTHFLSWQNFYAKNTNKGLIVRYEDLVLEPEKHYYLILKFICDLLNIKIDKIKFQNCLDTVTFENMKKFENKFGFYEKSKKAKHFFRSGKIDEWKNILDFETIDSINGKFGKEMKHLNYKI